MYSRGEKIFYSGTYQKYIFSESAKKNKKKNFFPILWVGGVRDQSCRETSQTSKFRILSGIWEKKIFWKNIFDWKNWHCHFPILKKVWLRNFFEKIFFSQSCRGTSQTYKNRVYFDHRWKKFFFLKFDIDFFLYLRKVVLRTEKKIFFLRT